MKGVSFFKEVHHLHHKIKKSRDVSVTGKKGEEEVSQR